MLQYNGRDLLCFNKEQIWTIPNGKMRVVFDDGVVTTRGKNIKLSWYFWEFFRLDQAAPFNIEFLANGKIFNKKSFLKLLSNCMFSTYLYRIQNDGKPLYEIEYLARVAYQVVNNLFNDMSTLLSEYVVSLDAEDYVDILDHPIIKETNANLRPTYNDIEHGYAVNRAVLMDENEFPGNRIAEGLRQASFSPGQVDQSITAVGFRTNVASKMYPTPVMSNFAEGITDLYEALVESQSASKAVKYTSAPLQKTQYYNREMQLLAQAVQNLHHFTDCGSTDTLDFPIRTNRDLEVLDGKWRLDEQGSLKLIRPNCKELIGTVVKIRSVTRCRHPDPAGVCAVCYGEIAHSVPKGTVIGHMSVVEICERISQIVLSTKHLDVNAKIEDFVPEEFERRFIYANRQDSTIGFKEWLWHHDPVLMFPIDKAANLAILGQVGSVKEISAESVAQFTNVSVRYTTGRNEITEAPLLVSMGSRRAFFTYQFLDYLKEQPRETNDKGYYLVSLENWDPSKPIFRLPDKHRNMLEFKDSIEKFVKATHDYERRLKHQVTNEEISQVLQDFHMLISSKLNINIVHLEMVLYSTMIQSSSEIRYGLPKPGQPCEFGRFSDILPNRSLAPLFAHQEQKRQLFNINSYLVTERHPTNMDFLLE